MNTNSLFTSTEINALFEQAHALQQTLSVTESPAVKQEKLQQLDRLFKKIAQIAKLEIKHANNPEKLEQAKELCQRALKLLNADPLRTLNSESLDKLQHKFTKAVKRADQAQQKLSGAAKFTDPHAEYAAALRNLAQENPLFREFLSPELTETQSYSTHPPNIERVSIMIAQLDGSFDPLVNLSQKQFFHHLLALQAEGFKDSDAVQTSIAQLKPLQQLPTIGRLVKHLERIASMNPSNRAIAKPDIQYFLPGIEEEVQLQQDLNSLKAHHPKEVQELIAALKIIYANNKEHTERIVSLLELTQSVWEMDPRSFPEDPALVNESQRRALILYHMATSNVLDRFSIYPSLYHFRDAKNAALIDRFTEWTVSLPQAYKRSQLDEITAKLPHPELTYSIRIDYLRLLKTLFPADSKQKILILGAGPAGLTRSLLLSLQNIPVQILEKRKPPAFTEGRENIIMLGMKDINDLKILNFLGVLSLAQSRKLLGNTTPLDPHALPIKIRDLERALTDMQEVLQPNVVTYEIPDLNIVKEGNTTRFISGATEIPATLLIDCTGRHSPVLEILGKTPRQISNKLFIGTAKFTGSSSWLEEAWYKIQAPVSLIAKSVDAVCKTSFSVSAVAKHIVQTSFALLLRVQNYDSLGIIFSKEDQAAFKKSIKKIEILNGKLLAAREQGLPVDDPQVLELSSKRTAAINAMNQDLQAKSENVRMLYDTILCWQVPTHNLRSLAYVSGNMVDVTMTKAQQPLFSLGDKDLLIRGDAHGTTDPMSAHGAKIAIESALADQFYIRMMERPGAENIARHLFTEMAEAFLAKAQVEGFNMRAKFYEHTEAYAYFMELGRTKGWVSNADVERLSSLFDRGQAAIEDRDFARWLPGDKEFLIELRNRLHERISQITLPEKAQKDPTVRMILGALKNPLEILSKDDEREAKAYASNFAQDPELRDLGIIMGVLITIDLTVRRLGEK